uniref:ornithine carbamoyltransferase n=1 Tax=Chromulina nebulosa TaxID=96789 RepID=A0A7S0SXR1_9STRA|mmetsp:Transcript_711/g.620  ORF Transcript_711/g.620 Transcript_711/m.620 type:complete len:337 (+) Transcript_711:26-1036(+)
MIPISIKSLCIKSNKLYVRLLSNSSANHFISISQLTNKELNDLIDDSIRIKNDFKSNPDKSRKIKPLDGTSMSMIFQKRSTRTRVSTETGIHLLGGHGLMLGPQDIQLGVNETLKDTARVLSRFNDIILARVFAHSDVLELAKESSVPVINALSDKYHPLQTLADLMTIKEHFGSLSGLKLAWAGDGNNVLHDLSIGSLKSGMDVSIATPTGYSPDEDVVDTAKSIATQLGLKFTLTTDPKVAVKDADIVVTDTWVSMGQEEEAKKRKIDFKGYQVNKELMALARPNAIFLHCLPRKPEEVSDDVFYSNQSLVFPEAENRMWTVMAVTLKLLGKKW